MSVDTANFVRVLTMSQGVILLVLLFVSFAYYARVLKVDKARRKIAAHVCLITLSYGLSVAGNLREMLDHWNRPPTYRIPLCLGVLTLGILAICFLLSHLLVASHIFNDDRKT